MAITISGENNNDRITAQDGVIDTISGFNIAGIITASSFTGDLTGNVTGNLSGNVTGNINNTTLLLQTGGNERVRIDSNGRVGLGINNPGSYFSSYNRVVMGRTNDTGGMTIVSAPTSGGYIAFADGTSGNEAYRGRISYYHSADTMAFNTAATERIRIDSSGRVLIGTTTEGRVEADDLTIATSGTTGITLRSAAGYAGNIMFSDGTSGDDEMRGTIQYHHYGDSMRFFTNATEKVRIDTSGRLGIGTVSPSALLHLHQASGDIIQKIESSNGAAALELRHTNGYGYINYRQDGAETFRVGQIAQFTSYSVYNPNSSLPYQLCVEGNGEVGINTHNPSDTLHLLRNNANHGIRLQRAGTNPGTALVQVHSNGVLSLQGGNNIHYVSGGSQQHIWYRAGTEIGRFDTSGSFNASNIVQVGTTNDSGELRIGHDGSSYRARLVSNSANRLTIDADGPERIQMHGGVIYMRPLNTEKSAAFVANGAVELYHNDVKKLETTSLGATITGRLVSDGLDIGDSESIRFGTGYDMNMYHDGSNGVINNSTGNFYIFGGNGAIYLRPSTDDEHGVVVSPNSSVQLYHNGNLKLETTTNGSRLYGAQQDLHGDVKFDNQTNSGMDLRWDESLNRLHFEQDNIKAVFGGSSDLEIYHNGSTNIINGLYHPIELRHQSEVHIKCVDDGAVELYHNNLKQCETSANGLVFPSGKGIDFSANGNASGMTSELLDIYEEGTWTPYIYPMSSNIPVTYSHQSGKYTRIGNVVHFVFKLQVSNITGNRNQGFGINGFPFNNTGSQDQISSEFYGETWSGEIPTTIKWIGNTNRGVCYFYTSSQHYQASSMLDINVTSSMLMGSGHYFTH